jgi:hypothetical protein
MTFRSVTWYRIAVVLSIGNLVGGWFAAGAGQPLHATTHAALALAFGLWAQRLRPRRAGEQGQSEIDGAESLEALKAELDNLRLELNETQERLDFAERVLAQRPEGPRVGPPRQDR